MKKRLLLIMVSVAVCLLFAPVSAGFVNNISATQTITDPTVPAGGSVNITISFSTPNEALIGAIEVNDTSLPAGWGISPAWDLVDVPHDDPSSGIYYIGRADNLLPAIWSPPNQAWAWTRPTSPKAPKYYIQYVVMVPPGTAPGAYNVHSYALSSPPSGGIQIAPIPGDTTITVTSPLSSSGAPPTPSFTATPASPGFSFQTVVLLMIVLAGAIILRK